MSQYPDPSPPPPLSSVLLLGGKSRRMGKDKAMLDWFGQPLWRWQWEKFAAAGLPRRRMSLRQGQKLAGLPPEAEVLFDKQDAQGVVEVLQTALEQGEGPVILLAVDLPLVPAVWLELLAEFSRQSQGQRGLAAFTTQGWEPLAALWPPQALGFLRKNGPVPLQKLLEAGERDGWMERYCVPPAEEEWFQNMNTMADYRQLEGCPENFCPELSVALVNLEDSLKSQSPEHASGVIGNPDPSGTYHIVPDEHTIQDGEEAPPPNPAVVATSLQRWKGSQWHTDAPDLLACEEPLEIRVDGQSIAVVMRTPGHDEELAVGFLVSEGVVKKKSDLFEVSKCPSVSEGGQVVDILLRRGSAVDMKSLTRHVFSSSSCGICGKAVIEDIFLTLPPIVEQWTVSLEWLMTLPDRLRTAQATFDLTGGLHASAIFHREGELDQSREDVGRHNALDKLLGWALRADRLPLSNHVLLVSGRVSFELMQKSLAAGIPMVVAISAPSSMAVDFARQSGQTLVGFLRRGGMNVYAHAERIKNAGGAE